MKTISIHRLLADCILVASFAILLFYISRLSLEEKRKYENAVREMMVSSNYQEAKMRFDKVTVEELKASGALFAIPIGKNDADGTTVYISKRWIPDTTGKADPKSDGDFDKMFNGMDAVKQGNLPQDLTTALNDATRRLRDADFEFFDSLLVSSLKAKGMDAPHQLELVFKDSTVFNKKTATPGFKVRALGFYSTVELPLDGKETAKYVYSTCLFRYLWKNILELVLLSLAAFLIIVFGIVELFNSFKEAKRNEQIQEDFSRLVAHNMNNPLAIISASLEALEADAEKNDDNPQRKQYLAIIGRQTDNLSGQIKSILKPYALSGLTDDFEKKDIKVVEKLSAIVDQAKLAFPGIVFGLRTDAPAETVIQANETMFDEMLGNILQNAIKYSPENPCIEVSLSDTPANEIISIKDNGTGIPQDKIKYLFERYYKVEKLSSTPGYGIGLNYVKQVADLHHWLLEVESRVGEGSTFSIIIPKNR